MITAIFSPLNVLFRLPILDLQSIKEKVPFGVAKCNSNSTKWIKNDVDYSPSTINHA